MIPAVAPKKVALASILGLVGVAMLAGSFANLGRALFDQRGLLERTPNFIRRRLASLDSFKVSYSNKRLTSSGINAHQLVSINNNWNAETCAERCLRSFQCVGIVVDKRGICMSFLESLPTSGEVTYAAGWTIYKRTTPLLTPTGLTGFEVSSVDEENTNDANKVNIALSGDLNDCASSCFADTNCVGFQAKMTTSYSCLHLLSTMPPAGDLTFLAGGIIYRKLPEIAPPTSIQGDPIITGLQGQIFKFDGRSDAWYANVASKSLQWNVGFHKFDTCPENEDVSFLFLHVPIVLWFSPGYLRIF